MYRGAAVQASLKQLPRTNRRIRMSMVDLSTSDTNNLDLEPSPGDLQSLTQYAVALASRPCQSEALRAELDEFVALLTSRPDAAERLREAVDNRLGLSRTVRLLRGGRD
jgi:hypothetical protein